MASQGCMKVASALLNAQPFTRRCCQLYVDQFSIASASQGMCSSSISTSARSLESETASSSRTPARHDSSVSALVESNAARQFTFRPRGITASESSEWRPTHRRGKLNRADWYHRRQRRHKKAERAQAGEEYLLARREELISQLEPDAPAITALDTKLDDLSRDWSEKNVPVRPQVGAAVAQESSAKVVSFDKQRLMALHEADRHLVKRKLDVLTLKVGYGKDVEFALPDAVKAFVLEQSLFCLYGIDKNQVSQIAARIRRIRPPEPYKGAGIRIVGESIKLRERKGK